MKWAGRPLRSALYTIINPIIPAFDMVVPSDRRTGTFCILGSYGQRSVNTKDKFTVEGFMNLEITQVIQGQFGGRAAIDTITDTILNAIVPTTNSRMQGVTGFEVVNVALENAIGEFSDGQAKQEFSNILTLVFQMNEV